MAYNESIHFHATYDKDLLKERIDKSTLPIDTNMKDMSATKQDDSAPPTSLLSNVCCEDVDSMGIPAVGPVICPLPQSIPTVKPSSSDLFVPVPPPKDGVYLRIGVLTISDRSFTKQYETGDLSGPAVERTLKSTIERLNSLASNSLISHDIVQRSIVPDELPVIAKTLQSWSTQCNLIFTTGGTGFSPRDVTPEATVSILEKECRGLMLWASMECSRVQPLAALSRGTAGVRGKCLIVNLPGSPGGAAQVVTVLAPVLVHAVKDL